MRLSLLAPWLLLTCAAPQVSGPQGPEARLDEVALPRPPRAERPAPVTAHEVVHLRGPADARASGAPTDSRAGVQAVGPSGAPTPARRTAADLSERPAPLATAPDASALTFALVEDGRRPARPLRVALARAPSALDAAPLQQAASSARIDLEAAFGQPASAAGLDAGGEPDLTLLDGHLTGGYPLLRDRDRFRASLVGGLRYVLIDPEQVAGAEVGGELELVGPFVGLRLQF